MREIENTRSLVAGDMSIGQAGGRAVRPISLASMAILELLGNECLRMLGENHGDKQVPMYALAEFVWVHAAAEEEVRDLVCGAEYDRERRVKAAVLEYAGAVGFGEIRELMEGIMSEFGAIKTGQFEIISEGGSGKN